MAEHPHFNGGNMYYIQKCGVYCQGIYWIGEDIKVGLDKLLTLAGTDIDDYHKWELIKYREVTNGSEYANDLNVITSAHHEA